MLRKFHPSGNRILIKFINKKINKNENIINKSKDLYIIPDKYKRKLLSIEEMAIVQSGGAYNKF
tara:strand:+ start:94 stop:285 length:192 start_codon:yes stop_codon:yes gene_type:complete